MGSQVLEVPEKLLGHLLEGDFDLHLNSGPKVPIPQNPTGLGVECLPEAGNPIAADFHTSRLAMSAEPFQVGTASPDSLEEMIVRDGTGAPPSPVPLQGYQDHRPVDSFRHLGSHDPNDTRMPILRRQHHSKVPLRVKTLG
jgi:hypothetical protein